MFTSDASVGEAATEVATISVQNSGQLATRNRRARVVHSVHTERRSFVAARDATLRSRKLRVYGVQHVVVAPTSARPDAAGGAPDPVHATFAAVPTYL